MAQVQYLTIRHKFPANVFVCLYKGSWTAAGRRLAYPFFHSIERYVKKSLIGRGSSKTMIAHWILALTQLKFRIAQQF